MAKTYRIGKGDKIPSFALLDEQGKLFDRANLYENPCVLYFYPKDDTPGCTKEACSFRDALELFSDMRVRVIGISPDTPESHNRFKEKYQINFTLLSDKEKELAKAFDVWQEKSVYGKKSFGVERSTFLINEEGVICWEERNVKIEGHIERLIHAIHEYTNLEPQE